ncbi:hypothetical protein BD408DRAFT_436637 [Parasitella parasitica]|nr:hypothetical protein BD408DRAFT_436637 [Parasitella parasitica]
MPCRALFPFGHVNNDASELFFRSILISNAYCFKAINNAEMFNLSFYLIDKSGHRQQKKETIFLWFLNLIGGNTGHNTNRKIVLGHKSTGEIGQITEGGQLFIHAKDKNSIVIDGTQFTEANVNFGILLREQYPDALSLRIRTAIKGTQYLEINFRTAAAREEALKKDFTY